MQLELDTKIEPTDSQKRKAWLILGGVALVIVVLLFMQGFRMFLGTRFPLALEVSESIIGGQLKSDALQAGMNTLEFTARTNDGKIVSDTITFEVLPPDPYGPYDPYGPPDPYGPYDPYFPPNPPTVAGVYVNGSNWAAGLSAYSMPVGSGDQLKPIPWVNADQIQIVFSEDVVVQQNDLEIRGVNATYAFSGFNYDSGTRIATWTLSTPLNTDKIMLVLAGSGTDPVRDRDGEALDGEWQNPADLASTFGDSYPSGNGIAGGDFEFRINAVPGDVNQNGAVTTADVGLTRSKVGTVIGDPDYDQQVDANANGAITTADVGIVRSRVGTALPSAEP